MNSEELSNYVYAKLAEAPKLSQDNIRTGDTQFEHRKTYFQVKKHIDEFLDGYVENRFLIMPGLRGVGKTTILFQIYEYLRKEKGVDFCFIIKFENGIAAIKIRILALSFDENCTYSCAGIIDDNFKEIFNVAPKYQSVTAKDIQFLAKKLFATAPILSIVGPKSSLSEVKAQNW